jgi:tetratricopeptide (TPR) repeat protein
VAVPDPGQVAADLGGIPESDRVKAEELAQRLASRTVNPADADVAEGLLARFPDEASMRNLLEAVLLTLAQKEQQKRDYASAARHLQRAAAVQPGSTKALLGLVAVGMEAGDWAGTEAAARAVLALEPRNVEAWRSLGFALLRQDRNREAAEALRTALGIRDDAVTRGLLEKVEKGMLDEGRMKERQLAHFHVRYDGEEHEAVGREILRALERHYATLVSALDHQPAAPIGVILFSRENYYDAAGAPAWSGGNYDLTDGRIRIPIGGLSSGLTPDIDDTLIHEVTHAFVWDISRGVAPREIHEGLAQYMEGKRVDSMLSREQMKWLADGRLGNTVLGFYWGALSFVEYLMALRGQGGMNDLLGAMGQTGSVDAAFRQVHGGGFAATQRAWQERMRRQYGS